MELEGSSHRDMAREGSDEQCRLSPFASRVYAARERETVGLDVLMGR